MSPALIERIHNLDIAKVPGQLAKLLAFIDAHVQRESGFAWQAKAYVLEFNEMNSKGVPNDDCVFLSETKGQHKEAQQLEDLIDILQHDIPGHVILDVYPNTEQGQEAWRQQMKKYGGYGPYGEVIFVCGDADAYAALPAVKMVPLGDDAHTCAALPAINMVTRSKSQQDTRKVGASS